MRPVRVFCSQETAPTLDQRCSKELGERSFNLGGKFGQGIMWLL